MITLSYRVSVTVSMIIVFMIFVIMIFAAFAADDSSVIARSYPTGSEVKGIVVNVQNFGVFVELDPGITGLIPASRLQTNYASDDRFAFGGAIKVQVLDLDPLRRRIGLAFVEALPD